MEKLKLCDCRDARVDDVANRSFALQYRSRGAEIPDVEQVNRVTESTMLGDGCLTSATRQGEQKRSRLEKDVASVSRLAFGGGATGGSADFVLPLQIRLQYDSRDSRRLRLVMGSR